MLVLPGWHSEGPGARTSAAMDVLVAEGETREAVTALVAGLAIARTSTVHRSTTHYAPDTVCPLVPVLHCVLDMCLLCAGRMHCDAGCVRAQKWGCKVCHSAERQEQRIALPLRRYAARARLAERRYLRYARYGTLPVPSTVAGSRWPRSSSPARGGAEPCAIRASLRIIANIFDRGAPAARTRQPLHH